MRKFSIILNLSLLLSGAIRAQQLPQGVSVYQMDNGLEVLLVKNPVLPMTGVNVVVKTGSAYENFATSGMSHMLEHLLFNGTTSRSQKELYDAVDMIGGYNNANTSYFHTNYMMVAPAENIKKGMEIQADMLFHSILPNDKFDKEKGIVLEEIARSLNSGDNQIERHTKSVLYQGHAVSLPTLGTYATIEAMQRDAVYSFYKNAYVPNNMVMSVVGNFQVDSMMSWIENYYGKVAPRQVVRETHAEWLMGIEQKSPVYNEIYHRYYNGEATILEIFYYLPQKLSPAQVDLLQVYFEEKSSDLEMSLKKMYPDLIQSAVLELIPSPIIDYMKIALRLPEEAISANIINIIDKKVKNIPFALPIEMINSQAIKTRTNFYKNIEKPHMFGIYNAELFAVYGIEVVLMSYQGKHYHTAAEELSTLVLNEKPVTIIHHPFKHKSAQIEQENVQTKRFMDEAGGLTIIARENPASQLMAIHYLMKHKAPFEAQFGKNSAWILHDCFAQRLRSPEIQKKSAAFGFTYTVNDNPFIPMDNIYLHPDFSYIRAEGLADDSMAGIRFLNDMLVNFKPSKAEFEKAVSNRQRIDGNRMPGERSQDKFEETYSRYIYEENPYQESSAELTYESLLDFAEFFFSPPNMIVSIVSPISVDSVITVAHHTFVHEKQDKQPGFEVYSQKLLSQSNAISELIDGDGEQSFIFWGFTVPVDLNDHAALTALSLILSDRITFDIREKQGRAYRMSSGIDIRDNLALFYVKLGTRPENIKPLQSQMETFFNMNYLKSLSEEEITKSINMYLGRMMFRRLSSINQAYYLSNSEYFYQDMNHDQKQLTALSQVTLKDVQDVAKRYMKVQNPISIVVQ